MTDFDPGAVPPSDDPLADPAEVELQERLDEAKALLDAFPPVTDPGRFLAPDAVDAAALLREHDVASFYQLHEALRPHKVLRIWLRAVNAAGKGMAEGEQKVAEKTRLIELADRAARAVARRRRARGAAARSTAPAAAGGCPAARSNATCCAATASATR